MVVISRMSSPSSVNISSTVSLKRSVYAYVSVAWFLNVLAVNNWSHKVATLCQCPVQVVAHFTSQSFFFIFFLSYVSSEMARFLHGEIPLFCGQVHIWYLGKSIFFSIVSTLVCSKYSRVSSETLWILPLSLPCKKLLLPYMKTKENVLLLWSLVTLVRFPTF